MTWFLRTFSDSARSAEFVDLAHLHGPRPWRAAPVVPYDPLGHPRHPRHRRGRLGGLVKFWEPRACFFGHGHNDPYGWRFARAA